MSRERLNPEQPAAHEERREQLAELLAQTVRENLDSFVRSLNVARAVVSAQPKGSLRGMELAKGWALFTLESSRIIARHNRLATTEILDSLERHSLIDSLTHDSPSASVLLESGSTAEVTLMACRGEEAEAYFVVENPGLDQLQTTFVVSDFTTDDGLTLPSAGTWFSPDNLHLGPSQEAVVKVAFKVGRKFEVGKNYAATVVFPELKDRWFFLKLSVIKSSPRQPSDGEERVPGNAVKRRVRKATVR